MVQNLLQRFSSAETGDLISQMDSLIHEYIASISQNTTCWVGEEQQLHRVKQLFSTLTKSYLHPGIFPKKILICSCLDKSCKNVGADTFYREGGIATESGALHCAISHLPSYLVK